MSTVLYFLLYCVYWIAGFVGGLALFTFLDHVERYIRTRPRKHRASRTFEGEFTVVRPIRGLLENLK